MRFTGPLHSSADDIHCDRRDGASGRIRLGATRKLSWVPSASLATYFIVHDLWLFSQATFYPSCFADTLRYTTYIADYTACGPDAAIGAGTRIGPVPAITLSNMLIIFGILLWVKIGWKWLALGTILATAFFAVPYSVSGGIIGNVGEPIISIAIVSTAAHISRKFGSH